MVPCIELCVCDVLDEKFECIRLRKAPLKVYSCMHNVPPSSIQPPFLCVSMRGICAECTSTSICMCVWCVVCEECVSACLSVTAERFCRVEQPRGTRM